jgi:S-adenosylmethionine synthetase
MTTQPTAERGHSGHFGRGSQLAGCITAAKGHDRSALIAYLPVG